MNNALYKNVFYISVMILAASNLFAANFTWDYINGNKNWNRSQNWAGGVIPESSDQTGLFFGVGVSSVNNITGLTVGHIRIENTVTSHDISGNDLGFAGTTDIDYFAPGTSTISNNINLANGRNLQVRGDGGTLILSGNISDGTFNNGRLTKFGTSTLVLSGTNDFAQRLRIREGVIESRSADGLGFSRLDYSSADNAETTIRIRDVSQTFGGQLRTEDNASGIIDVASGLDFTLNGGTGLRFNNAGGVIKKAGGGTLVLDSAGVGDGTFIAQEGVTEVLNTSAFGGSGNGVVVEAGAEVQLQNVTVTGESVTLSGSGVAGEGALVNASGNSGWNGDITLAGNATIGTGTGGSFDLSGSSITLGANNLDLNGSADVSLGAAVTGTGALNINTTGTTTVSGTVTASALNVTGGTLLLNGADLIGDATNLSLDNGTFDTNGNSDSVGALSLSGSSELAVGGNSITFSDISGTGSLQITGWNGATTGVFSSGGVSDTVLSQIVFINPEGFAPGVYEANLIAGNQIVPVPEVSTILSGIGLFVLGLIYVYRRQRSNS